MCLCFELNNNNNDDNDDNTNKKILTALWPFKLNCVHLVEHSFLPFINAVNINYL